VPGADPGGGGRLFAVGSYTEAYGPFRATGEGITIGRFARGGAETVAVFAELPNPAYLRWHGPDLLHAVVETDDARAAIATLRLDADGRLRLLGSTPVPGRIPCHVDVDPTGRWLACPCYGSGDLVLCPVGGDGRVGAPAVHLRRSGRSIHAVRQASAHPHSVRFATDGRRLLLADLGTDQVSCWRFDPRCGALVEEWVWRAPPGSGPRMLLFDAAGRHLLVVDELASTVTALAWKDGRPEAIVTAPALAGTPPAGNTAAGLRRHPDGRLIAVSSRGADRVALLEFAPEQGVLRLADEAASGGAKPRDLDFSPDGDFLVVANQDGDNLAVLAVDRAVNRLIDTGERLGVRSPSCIRFRP
jgi:6-phosphogluconolactonase